MGLGGALTMDPDMMKHVQQMQRSMGADP